MDENLKRRDFLRLASGSAIGASVLACQRASTPGHTRSSNAVRPIRLVSVPTAVEGGLLPILLADFEKATGRKVDVAVGSKRSSKNAYDLAREGACDLILSHYGHRQAEEFVVDGWGEWPRTICSNQ